MKNFILIITLLLTQNLFALVSIAPVEIGEKPGLNGEVALSLETKSGNTDKEAYSASTRVAYDNNVSYVAWAELSGEYGESEGKKDTNKAFSHIRYIHTTYFDDLKVEAFAQLQSDEFRLIKSRTLGGAGVRYKLFSLFGKDKGYIGLGAFHESINYSSNDPDENNVRLNTYFAYTIDMNENSKFSYTLYYQPKIDSFSDYVQSHEAELKVKIYKQLSLRLSVTYDLDSKPPMNVKKEDFTQKTALVFEF